MSSRNFFIRVSLQEKILFTKNLALALKSGVSLVNSLKLLQNQFKSGSFKKIIASLLLDANRGVFLSDGLARFKNVFGELFINIIRVAETSGTLPENLIYLGDELNKRRQLEKKVKGALIYPMIILIATVVISVSMVVFVFPKILPLFQNANVELPLTTRILIGISNLILHHGILMAGVIVCVIIGSRFLLTVKVFHSGWHRFLLFLPIAGRAIINFNMANFTRTLGLLLRSGVKITEGIDITAVTLTNLVYQRHLRGASDRVRKGEFLSKYLAEEPKIFPSILTNLIEVGENTGNLSENLDYLAEYYENEVDDFVKNLSSILEPILLLIMGGVVGFIALSFITPIYQLTRVIK